MKIFYKIGITLILSVLLCSSAYAIFFTGTANQTNDNQNNTNEEIDSLPPRIVSVPGDLTESVGNTATISINFSDNIGVTSAKLFYRPQGALAWSSKSILSGIATLLLPPDSNESWYYYVTVNDAAGNGPIGDPSVDGSSYYTITVINNENNNSEENNPSDEGNNSAQNASRFVFVELGTKIVCSECPKVSAIIDELYKSGKYPFYYVSLPMDNPNALKHLTEYNILGYPTVYIDGGYRVLMGSTIPKSDFEKNISAAASRVVSNVSVNTTAQWDNHTNVITVHVNAINRETSTYNGRLRVYITELISTKWQASTPEHFSFLDFLVNEDVQIPGTGNISLVKTMNASGLDPEDLMLFSVLFNAEKSSGYSQPPDKNPFDAHYVDAVSATRVVKAGNLPPEVGIQNPSVKYFHRFGKPVRNTLTGKTILLGKTTIVASAHDDSAISKVEFYINGKLMATVTKGPYQWTWHKFAFGKRAISVKAYDDTGKVSTASMTVAAFIL
jgi:hypothetical protein